MTDPQETSSSELEQARAEIAALRARVAELEKADRDRDLAPRALQVLPHMVYVYDLAEHRNVYTNRSMADMLGHTSEYFIELGANLFATLMHPDDLEAALAHHAKVAASRDGDVVELSYRFKHANGTWRWLCSQDTVFRRDEGGRAVQLIGIVQDVTVEREREAEERERAEAERHRLVQAQEAVLRELGTPLIPIADQIIAMPLVGSIDRVRAQLILETLLGGISAQSAAVAILDVTGVRSMDADVADALVRTAKAARLLGTEVILTGVGPKPAQTLVELGTELHGIATHGTFQQGIAVAMRRVSVGRRSAEAR